MQAGDAKVNMQNDQPSKYQITDIHQEQFTLLLSTLIGVSNLVSSTLELKPLLESILDLLKTIIDYQGAKIFIVDGEYVKLMAHRSTLSAEEASGYNMPYRDQSIGIDIVLGKKPVIIDDIFDDTETAEVFRGSLRNYLQTALKNARSWMGIPLIVKDKVIGVLTTDHSEVGYYTPSHADLGLAFANQAAIEIENARLYSESMKKADELKTMLSIQQAITSRLDLDSVLKMIADEAKRLTNAYSTSVLLVEGENLLISAFSGDDPMKLLGSSVPISQSFLGRFLRSGKSGIFRNIPENPDAKPEIIEKAGAKSYLVVPLMAGSKPVGIISASNKLDIEFTAEDERILNMFASSAVIGIENARMYREEQRLHQNDNQRRKVAEGLRDILAILNSNRSLEEILDYIIKQAIQLMGVDTGILYRLHEKEGVLVIRAAVGVPAELIATTKVPIGTGAIGQAVLERKPVVVNDVPALIEQIKTLGMELEPQIRWISGFCNGMVAVPLLCKDEIYGGIALYLKNKRTISEEEIELTNAFADQAALAIDNARLRTQAEKMAVSAERSRLARDLHDAVTQTLFSASLIAEVLPKLWERNPEEGRKRLEELRQLTRGALAEMRILLLELRPATLAEAKLEELMRQLSEATTGRARIPVTMQLNDCSGMNTEVKVAIYRITQEAINNISKHSGASAASIKLRLEKSTADEEQQLELFVSDNGRGFDQSLITGEHLGLSIMKERAEAIGAEFMIDSAIGAGTTIKIRWRGRCC